ncbi:hypothetical protein BH09MYX1_BH09MYX1_43390 [soil metagenome]
MRFLRSPAALLVTTALFAGCSDSGDAPIDVGVDGGASVDAAIDATQGAQDAGPPQVMFPRTGISASELGVLVNDDDPLSVAISTYYVAARNIPPANVVHVKLPTGGSTITNVIFDPVKTQVDAALPKSVQALAITWTKPYAVEKTSITSAFAMGFRTIADTCNDPMAQAQSANPYLKKRTSTSPFTDLAFRPTMTIPATTIEEAKTVIDRGIAADDTWPTGDAYLMKTSDLTRSARCIVNAGYGWTNECQTFLNTWDTTASGIGASIVSADFIENEKKVLFYVQGLASVTKIATNTFLPGAVADHLTSYGGQIPTSGQMSAFEFIKGGATGSYGTVVEPCAFQQKFPDPSVLIPAYFGGGTLIEAYWKSVVWPIEGIFIGEPLARPFGTGFRSTFTAGKLTIETTTMVPGHKYLIESADASAGPFTTVLGDLSVTKYQRSTFDVPNAQKRFYSFREQ